jgi:hypothetical protein
MAKIVDPDGLSYADYTFETAIDPSTALNGGPANMLIDYENKRFALTAPRYGTVGTGVSEMVGFGATGGVSGQALYSKFKNIWKDDTVAIRFPFPMEAITPESFEFINGWLPDETTQDSGNGNSAFITRALIKDAGWAERAPNGNIGRKYFGTITLGANALGATGFTTVYYNAVNPGIQTSITIDSGGSVDTVNNTIVFDGVVGNGNTFVSAPYFYTGDAVVYQTDGTGGEPVTGITTNGIYYIRYVDTDGAIPTGVGHSFTLHNTRDDALTGTSPINLTGSNTGELITFTAAGVPEEFFFGISEEGSFANEPVLFYDTVQENNVSAGNTILYNRDNFYEIFVREETKTYGKQNNTDIGVAVINNQAYRFPLTSQDDINITIADGDGTTTGIATAAYAGIGISFYQAPQTVNIAGVGDKDFNIFINADGQPLQTVYSKVQYLLRQPIRVNSGVAGTDINSLSGVGYNNGDGGQDEFDNSFRYGAIQQPLLQFTGSRLDALAVDDIFDLSNKGTDADNLGNLGIYISGVAAGDINDVRYLDNNGDTVDEAFTSTVDLTFNNNLFNDGSARFWVFYDEADSVGDIIPGLSTALSQQAGTVGSVDGIIDATNEFIVGGGVNHPFVTGQKVVAISTEATAGGIGIAATTTFDPRTLGPQGQGITTGVYYLNVVKSVGVAQTYIDITESGDNAPGSSTLNVIGVGQTSAFKLHNSYSDAIANNYAGINTVVLTASGTAGVVTFTQIDVNFSENNATIVKSGSTGGQVGEVNANTFMDGIDIPANGEITFSYDYESNDQRNRTPGNASNVSDAAIRVVAVGLQTGQYASATASITRAKNQAVSVTGALERVYSNPA